MEAVFLPPPPFKRLVQITMTEQEAQHLRWLVTLNTTVPSAVKRHYGEPEATAVFQLFSKMYSALVAVGVSEKSPA